jgi:hypothetical protein
MINQWNKMRTFHREMTTLYLLKTHGHQEQGDQMDRIYLQQDHRQHLGTTPLSDRPQEVEAGHQLVSGLLKNMYETRGGESVPLMNFQVQIHHSNAHRHDK